MAAAGDVVLELGSVELAGDLAVPSGAEAIVLFAHGSGSSRRSSRNRAVAATLQDALLSDEEETIDARTAELRFDISLLADRLLGATRWVGAIDGLSEMRIGYFGASTGAAAALVAAAEDHRVGAVVSRGGRPDLAHDALARVTAPTLLIVGGADTSVIAMNEEAMGQLRCEKLMEIVPGASHLFEEPGALERVAEQARAWFADKLFS